jgi:1-deoxy-D-xylulose-5-phosphate reductoisomerase
MTHPIKYAIFYPNNYFSVDQKMGIDSLNNLTFETINEDEYHALKLVRSVLNEDSKDKSIILNSSNEVAVKAFLDKKIRFIDILVVVEESIEYVSKLISNNSLNYRDNLDNILNLDSLTRQKTEELIKLRF